MDNYHDKAWGRTRCVVDSKHFQRHELLLKQGGFCSVHYHEHRANRFIVYHPAVVLIYQWHAWDWSVDLLAPDEHSKRIFEVPSRVPHMFAVVRSGEILEEYWADRGGEVRIDDIQRLVAGGMMPIHEMLSGGYNAVMSDFRERLELAGWSP